jgi:hypothetical protein
MTYVFQQVGGCRQDMAVITHQKTEQIIWEKVAENFRPVWQHDNVFLRFQKQKIRRCLVIQNELHLPTSQNLR